VPRIAVLFRLGDDLIGDGKALVLGQVFPLARTILPARLTAMRSRTGGFDAVEKDPVRFDGFRHRTDGFSQFQKCPSLLDLRQLLPARRLPLFSE
jgi:hypothetical protein